MAAEIQRVSAEALRKTEGKFVRIGDCLYVRNGRLYGVKTIKGRMGWRLMMGVGGRRRRRSGGCGSGGIS